jgi:hypothetical protein
VEKRILKIDPRFDGKFSHIRSLPSHDEIYDMRYQASVERMRREAGMGKED